ncbi:MAG: YgiQ family radical SAM protein [Betaproteobacteria bacterium]|nr:YgiQ family radical SAM protein [Betaproteobacteria bacterium]
MRLPPATKLLTAYRQHWAHRFGASPFLPLTPAEIEARGWGECDVVLVTGDAYIDHPSFGMALIGRLLEAQGFRVGIISQPDWQSAEAFRALGKPKLFFGVTAGNMDSMVNRYTSDRKIRSDDAYTPNAEPGKRPDRAVVVYAQRCREAYPGTPVVIGSIEASLRRIAHYDYWSDTVRRSVLADSKADLLLFGNAERAIVELAHRLAKGVPIESIRDLRGSAFMVPRGWRPADDWLEFDSTQVDRPGAVHAHPDPYAPMPMGNATPDGNAASSSVQAAGVHPALRRAAQVRGVGEASPHQIAVLPASAPPLPLPRAGEGPGVGAMSGPKGQTNEPAAAPTTRRDARRAERAHTVIRLPAYEEVKSDPVLYAHASRSFHLESNPGNARALVQAHGERDVWLNPPPVPLTTPEMDYLYGLPYARAPHPSYGKAKIPAWEMIRFSINIMRGCFGGCTFCSITEHEGRIIQSRSEASILREIEDIRDKTPGFTGIISDLGGPTANMYRLQCKDPAIEEACRRLSCVYPDICPNMGTDHGPLVQIYRKARTLPGVKKVLIGSGLRYDLAVRSPEYVKELVSHHVGGYLKIAPEHTEAGPLAKMMKPGIGSYDKFKAMFDQYSKEAGKEQYLIPYFIAAHPGTTDEDMLALALWLKRNGFRLDQVQNFLPTPLSIATAMWHSEKNPLRKVSPQSETVSVVRGERRRKLHKAFLRYHDPMNWPMLREALRTMGRADLIGNGKRHLVPAFQPLLRTSAKSQSAPAARGARKPATR